MKKIIVIITVLLIGTIVTYSQDDDIQTYEENEIVFKSKKEYAKHRFHMYGSVGYGNNIYDRINKTFIHDHYSYNLALDFKYAFFFAPKWGFSLGAGVSRFEARGTLNIEGVLPRYYDPAFDPTGRYYYDLYYKTNDLVEKQEIYALEAPLQFHFEHRIGQNGIFASLGAKGYFPIISAQSMFPQGKGTITTKGYEEFTDTWYTDPPHFGEHAARTTPAKVKLMRSSVDIIAEFGGVFRVNHKSDFYVGAYGSYGCMDILPKFEDKINMITHEQNDDFAINSMLASNFTIEYNKYIKNNNLDWKRAMEKWNRWQVGIKIGFHFKFGGKKPEKIKVSTPIYRDTINIVNVINVPPAVYTEGSDYSQKEKESISTLTTILRNGIILFDLDSDVPKIENKKFIPEAVEVLQKEPNLRLIIEGYTCELGSEKHNRDLAARRANAIRNLFIKQGVLPSRIQAEAYTASDPESKLNIIDDSLQAHRAVIFRIIK